ncbi:MAG: PEP-CTERM sorting domain-containing protein, partial [Thermoguttaceae bacterium]|nr:PEP-CTERM sorting domain-containing protein [Thermoguttaceae bacterium]
MNGSFTASAWVNLDSLSDDQSIFGNTASSSNVGLHLVVRNAHPHMGFYGNDLTASNVTLETGKWYYLTFQYDASAQTQTIYMNGEQKATRTGAAAFAGANVLDLGTSLGGRYLNGKLKGVTITDGVLSTDQIQAQMNASGNNAKAVETFAWGVNRDEWYSGGGASLGNAWANGTLYTALTMYHAPTDAAAKTIVDQGNNDKTTGMVWGAQFTVLENAPEDAVLSVDVMGGATALNVNSRASGGGGIALWDLTTKDYVRDSSNNIISYAGNGTNDLQHCQFSLNGLQGHNLMVVAIDRNTGGWGWVGLTNLEADTTQVSAIAGAEQHHLILNDFNFDTAGDFNGMYEVDADGNRLDSVTHFTNGSRNGSAATNYYVDSSGTFDKGKKGFLSTGTAAYGEEQTTGILRSDPFLIQGDILEYYIAGGNNINNKHLDLIDADTGEVYFSVTGESANDFRYDFLNLKDIQGKSVYLRVVDADGGTSWSHLELDQIRQVKFAPSAVEVQAASNSFDSRELKFYEVEPGFNVNSYNLDETVTDLTSLADYITGGADATEKKILVTLDNFKVTDEGEPVGVDVFSVLNVKSSGLYTLVIGNDEPFVLKLNGKQVIASEGSEEEPIFIPLQFSEVGQYALEMLYLDTAGKGVSIYAAQGAYNEWQRAAVFELLSGTGEHNLLAYAQNPDPNKIPEPSTWALLILGAAGMLYWRKRK